MSDNRAYAQARKSSLFGSGVTSTATTMILSALVDPQGNTLLTADFGAVGYGVLEPGTVREENFSFTTVTQNADGTATLTGVVRGLDFAAPYTTVAGLKKEHGGSTVVIISNSAPFYNNFANKENDETISQEWTFSTANFPQMSEATTAPTDDEDLATKKYVDDTAGGTPVSINRTVVSATAGETVASGEFVYLDETDNEWKLTNASASATCDNVQLAIAQGAGTDGSPITGGVLIIGRDSNQAGLTAGDKLFLSDTPGAVAASAGTVEVEVGHAVTATTMDFAPKFASFTTKLQRDALAGTSGTPSTSNKYVTDDDTAATPAASKIVRFKADSLLDDAGLALTTAGDIVYSDGTDLTRLGIGTAGQVLATNSGATAPEWIEKPQALGSSDSNTFYNYEMMLTSEVLTLVNNTFTDTPNYGHAESSGTAWSFIGNMAGHVADLTLQFDTVKKTTIQFRAIALNGVTGDRRIGFGGGGSAFSGAYNLNSENFVGFAINATTIYAATAQNSTNAITTTDINAGLVEANWNLYRIELDAGTDVKFYVNGTLKATHTTNLPTAANTVVFGGGGTANGEDWAISQVIVSQEL